MTTENLADVIEAALLRMWDDGNATGLDGWVGPDRGSEPDDYAIEVRRKRVDRELEKLAHLLADPADRDERRNEAYRAQLARADRAEAEVVDLVTEAIRQKRRANDAIAEVAELREKVEELRAELRVTTNERDRSRVYGRELRAMIDRVRALADEWTNDLKSYPNRAVEVRRDDLRAALDGAGESDGE